MLTKENEATSKVPKKPQGKNIQMNSHPNVICIVHHDSNQTDPLTGLPMPFTELAIRNEGFVPLPLISDQPISYQEILEKSSIDEATRAKES